VAFRLVRTSSASRIARRCAPRASATRPRSPSGIVKVIHTLTRERPGPRGSTCSTKQYRAPTPTVPSRAL
jgi:hypothetical protein